jgi:type II secretory pathway pseudopilin PulG
VNGNKQLINLAGVLIVAVLIVAGVALIAMPLYSESQSTDAQTQTVAGSNAVYEQRIVRLTEAQSRIAASAQLDDVYRLISTSAKDVDMRIESIEVGEAAAWVPRDALDEEGNAVVPEGEATTPATTAEADAAADDATSDSASAEGAAVPEEAAEESPQRQVLLTITLDVRKPYEVSGTGSEDNSDETIVDTDLLAALAARTARFVDGLAEGPRLVSPIDVTLEEGKLVVTALTYFRMDES